MPRHKAWFALAALAFIGCLALSSLADDNVQGGDKKVEGAAATCTKVQGALLQRTKDGFKSVKAGDPIPPHTLLIACPEAELVPSSGKVGIKLLVYLGVELPVTESAITFHEGTPNVPDISVDRGVVAVKNLNEKGDAQIRVQGGKQAWELTLQGPETTALVARFGRHMPGTKLLQGGLMKEQSDEPMMHMGVLVIKGSVAITTGSHNFKLTAPPGAAMLSWEKDTGFEVKHLETIPDEVQKLKAADAKLFNEGCDIIARLAAGDLGKGIDELVIGDSALKRKIAVVASGAIDDLPRLWGALENAKYSDVREQAVMTLRQWIGRQPGQVAKLDSFLTKSQKFPPAQARTVVMLLKGFDDQDRKEPFVYQLLIGALEHAPLPIRELAHWHLERLAPAGQKIVYDAAAGEEARSKAAAQWRQLIPEGHLPPAPKKDGKSQHE